MITASYQVPLRVRYKHVGQHRNLTVSYIKRNIFYAVLLALMFDAGFFLIINTVDIAINRPHGTIVRYHVPTGMETPNG